MYYSLLGTILTIVIGYIVSICTQSSDDAYDFNLIHPTIYKYYDKYFEYKPYIKKVETKGKFTFYLLHINIFNFVFAYTLKNNITNQLLHLKLLYSLMLTYVLPRNRSALTTCLHT